MAKKAHSTDLDIDLAAEPIRLRTAGRALVMTRSTAVGVSAEGICLEEQLPGERERRVRRLGGVDRAQAELNSMVNSYFLAALVVA